MPVQDARQQRSDVLFKDHRESLYRQTDRLFAKWMLFQWVATILAAWFMSPPHVWAAIFLGGALTLFPVAMALKRPGQTFTRHFIAVGQMLMSALLIHLTGGRTETHFHIFGSLAFLAFYRDWRVLLSATAVVALDPFVRGLYGPQSVYGVLALSPWRWLEHTGWVVFEDLFLVGSCIQGLKDLRAITDRQAELEGVNAHVERRVKDRTRELWTSEERFRALSESSPIGIFKTDSVGRCLYANKRWQDIAGLNGHQMLGHGWLKVIHPEDHVNITDQWLKAAQGGKPFDQEFRLITPEGQVRYVHYRSNVLVAEKGGLLGHVGTVEDMTDRRKMELAWVQSEKMSAVGTLAAGVAHEINNPLAVITGFAQILIGRVPPEDGLFRPLQSILRETTRCKNLVKDLLTFSRVSRAELETLNLNEAAEGALSFLRMQAHLVKVDIKTTFAPYLPSILGNRPQIHQMLTHLCKNALDAMPEGGCLSVTTDLVHDKTFAWACLKVIDTGCGISKEVLPRIIEPFFSTKPVGQGIGLGLSLSHEIIKKHSGTLDIQSRPGLTEFSIRFPVRSREEIGLRMKQTYNDSHPRH